jgi:hypothetical protein
MVWRMLSGEGTPEPPPPAAPAEPAPPPRRRLRAGELRNDIEAAFDRLPDLFIFSDVYEAIGYAPDRGSLHRVLQDLKSEGYLALHSRGTGTQPTRYRKLRVATEGSES